MRYVYGVTELEMIVLIQELKRIITLRSNSVDIASSRRPFQEEETSIGRSVLIRHQLPKIILSSWSGSLCSACGYLYPLVEPP